MHRYYVYILECSDSSYYTGITNNLERRFHEHQNGLDPDCYTVKRRPLKLVFTCELGDVNQAIAFEKQVKGWSRVKKKAIINNNWHLLPDLSKSRT